MATGRGAAALLLVGVLAGCGQQEGGRAMTGSPEQSTPGPSAAGTSTPGTATPGPDRTAPPLPTSADELLGPLPGPSRRASGALRTLTGTVVPGVESGCLLLSTAQGAYLLVGGDRAVLRAGATVTVQGRPDPTLLTTCQQGVPFVVASVS